MRPLSMTLTAFGPYAQPLTLNFADLQSHTFFLIHGPTGAGKSAILDAMCYALYGKTSGGERDGDQMRSHHAGALTKTEIYLDFAVGAERYRVQRCPEFERPKARGSGTKTESKQATLWRRTHAIGDEPGEVLAARWEAVDTQIKTILGFDSAQFRQVAILPQGQFRQFLLANSADREKILGVLFQTQSYQLIEARLKDAAQGLEREIAQYRARLQAIYTQADVETYDALDALTERVRAQIIAHLEQLDVLTQAETDALQQLEQGKHHHQLLSERDAARAALIALDAERPRAAVQRGELQAAERALSIDALMRGLAQRREEANDADRQFSAARAAHAAAQRALAEAQTVAEREAAREPEHSAAHQQLISLRQLVEQATRLADARTQIAVLNQRVQTALAAATAARTWVAAAQRQRDTAANELTSALEVAGTLEAERLRVQQLTVVHTDAVALARMRRDLDTIVVGLSQGATLLRSLEAAYHDADAALREAQDQWEAGQAAVLAQRLVDGQPCPVCGAAHHPAPAQGRHVAPPDTTLKHLQKAAREAQAELATAQGEQIQRQSRQETVQQRIEDLEQRLGARSGLLPEVIYPDLSAAKIALERAEQAASSLERLRGVVEAQERALESAQHDTDVANQVVDALNHEWTKLHGQVVAYEAHIPEHYRDPVALAAAIATQQRTLDDLSAALKEAQTVLRVANEHLHSTFATLTEREQAAAAATTRFVAEEVHVASQRQAAGFQDDAAYREARRSEAELDVLRSTLERFDSQLNVATDRAQRANTAAAGLTPPDLSALTAAAGDARDSRAAVQEVLSTLRAQLTLLERLLAAAQVEQDGLGELTAQYSVVKEVARIANGDNPLRITFHRYVLAALLDQVLIDASHRLQVMSNGRYALRRAGSPQDRRRVSGLDLEVLDAYTGQPRAIHTLSGGESFQAALALALGLADAAQAHAGGIHLETLFVDEGFGSLDQHALELALQTLGELQVGGRLVGIISHVTELQERISARLEVRPTPTGSTAHFVVR